MENVKSKIQQHSHTLLMSNTPRFNWKKKGVKDVNKSLYLCNRFQEILRDFERFLVAFSMNRYCV